jgi:hypothetical protein
MKRLNLKRWPAQDAMNRYLLTDGGDDDGDRERCNDDASRERGEELEAGEDLLLCSESVHYTYGVL